MTEMLKEGINSFNGDPILQATWLYYQDGLNQSEIAKILKISRVTVLKYLQTAREKGYVHINLNEKVFSSISRALEIKKKFKLDNVIIIPTSEVKLLPRERIANAAAMYISQFLKDNDVLGVAWGRTIDAMGKILTPIPLSNVTVIQMLGSMPYQPDFSTIEISAQIAKKVGGRCENLHVPAVVSSSRLALELQAEPIIRDNFSILTKCNKALLMVGNLNNDNPLIRVGVLSEVQMNTYKELGAVGVLCGRFYDKHGEPVVTELDLRILGITLPQLRQIKHKVFMSCGDSNYDSALGAILGGFVTDLIIDEGTAKFLLETNNL